MASYKSSFKLNREEYYNLFNYMVEKILEGSVSASFEESEHFEIYDVISHCLAFERYASLGGNRVSLTISTVHYNDMAIIFIVSTGRSQATFFKINTYSEENFLELAVQYLEEYMNRI